MKFRQTLLFVGLTLTLLYSYITQRTPQPTPPKPQRWEVAFEQPFEVGGQFSEGLAVIGTGEKYGYIDKTSQVVIKPQFDWANAFSEGMACVTINSKEGFINQSGEIVVMNLLMTSRTDSRS
jgi:WG repeat protein